MKTTSNEDAPLAEANHRSQCTQIDAIRAKGEYKIRLTSLSIVALLVIGGIIFSLVYPSSLTAIWAVITPLILTIFGITQRNNGKSKPLRK